MARSTACCRRGTYVACSPREARFATRSQSEEDGMSTTRVRVTRTGQEGTSRSFVRRHVGFAISELLALLAALALAVIVRSHPGPLPGDVGAALALQHLLLP